MSPPSVVARVERYLQKRVREGTHFFKSRYIADDLGFSVKRVGKATEHLRNELTTLDIESWGGNSDAHTWYVDLCSHHEE